VKPSRTRVVLLALAFALAATVTVAIGVRFVASTIYWSQHRDEPIQPWMTVGMVARSYDVPRDRLAAVAGVDPEARDRRTLAEIASARGLPVSDLVAALQAEIDRTRAERERGP
jgi:hypothetical protein